MQNTQKTIKTKKLVQTMLPIASVMALCMMMVGIVLVALPQGVQGPESHAWSYCGNTGLGGACGVPAYHHYVGDVAYANGAIHGSNNANNGLITRSASYWGVYHGNPITFTANVNASGGGWTFRRWGTSWGYTTNPVNLNPFYIPNVNGCIVVTGWFTRAPAAPTLSGRTTSSITLNTVSVGSQGHGRYQYQRGAGAWQDSPTFTGLAASTSYTFQQRWAGSDDSPGQPWIVSPTSSSVTLSTLPATPSAAVSFTNETLTNLVAGASYRLMNGSTQLAAWTQGSTATTYAIQTAWMGGNRQLIRTWSGLDSAAQTINIPARPTTPSAPTINYTNETINTAATHQWRTGTNAWSAAVANQSIASAIPAAGGTAITVSIRLAATTSAFASAASGNTTVPARPTTPSAPTINFTNETINTATTHQWRTGTNAWSAAGANQSITSVIPAAGGTAITVSIRLAATASAFASAASENMSVPARPATPTTPTPVHEATIGGNGSIENVDATMEYRLGTSGGWTNAPGTSIPNLAPGTYEVRLMSTSTDFASLATTVTIDPYTGSKHTQPNAGIDYETEHLNGLVAGAEYKLMNGGTQVATWTQGGSATTQAIDPTWMVGAARQLIRVGDGMEWVDSDPQNITIPIRQTMPGLTPTHCSVIQNNNGSITGVTTAMEWKLSTETDLQWKNVTLPMNNLSNVTYNIRIKAVVGTSFRSTTTNVTINPYIPGQEPQPMVTIDYIEETLTVTNFASGRTRLNGSIMSTATVSIQEGWYGTSLTFIIDGDGSTTIDSPTLSLPISARPVLPPENTPDGKIDYEEETITNLSGNHLVSINGGSATIINFTAAYKIQSSWFGNTLTIIKPGNGTTSSNSLPQSLPIPTRPAAPKLGKVDATTKDINDGQIMDVDTTMEWRQGISGDWTSIADSSEIIGLGRGQYQVRIKSTSDAFAGEITTVSITDFKKSSLLFWGCVTIIVAAIILIAVAIDLMIRHRSTSKIKPINKKESWEWTKKS